MLHPFITHNPQCSAFLSSIWFFLKHCRGLSATFYSEISYRVPSVCQATCLLFSGSSLIEGGRLCHWNTIKAVVLKLCALVPSIICITLDLVDGNSCVLPKPNKSGALRVGPRKLQFNKHSTIFCWWSSVRTVTMCYLNNSRHSITVEDTMAPKGFVNRVEEGFW